MYWLKPQPIYCNYEFHSCPSCMTFSWWYEMNSIWMRFDLIEGKEEEEKQQCKFACFVYWNYYSRHAPQLHRHLFHNTVHERFEMLINAWEKNAQPKLQLHSEFILIIMIWNMLNKHVLFYTFLPSGCLFIEYGESLVMWEIGKSPKEKAKAKRMTKV